ncbi:hypothetical protein BS78_05G114700 [Paspalum vaginatum]|nr:hypothetical protein BS78_05G114700 [Paspalum vaginatum]
MVHKLLLVRAWIQGCNRKDHFFFPPGSHVAILGGEKFIWREQRRFPTAAASPTPIPSAPSLRDLSRRSPQRQAPDQSTTRGRESSVSSGAGRPGGQVVAPDLRNSGVEQPRSDSARRLFVRQAQPPWRRCRGATVPSQPAYVPLRATPTQPDYRTNCQATLLIFCSPPSPIFFRTASHMEAAWLMMLWLWGKRKFRFSSSCRV